MRIGLEELLCMKVRGAFHGELRDCEWGDEDEPLLCDRGNHQKQSSGIERGQFDGHLS